MKEAFEIVMKLSAIDFAKWLYNNCTMSDKKHPVQKGAYIYCGTLYYIDSKEDMEALYSIKLEREVK